MLDGLFGLDVNWATLGIALLAVGALAYLIAEVAAWLVRTVFVTVSGDDGGAGFQGPIVRRPIRVTRAAVFVAALFALIPPALQLAGVPVSVGLELTVLTGWLLGSGLRIVVIALITYLLIRVTTFAAQRLEDQLTHGSLCR